VATGPRPIELERCGSTQDELRAIAAQGAPAWTCVRCDEQLEGRGRRGRTWHAPAGTAMLASILLRPARPAEELPTLALVGGLAACEVACDLGVAARVRWPNDVVTDQGKLAGVLAELVTGDAPCVLLGIGLNASLTREQLPPTDRLPATSFALEGIAPPPLAVLLDRVLERLAPLVELWESGGFAAIAPRLRDVDDLSGRCLRLQLASGRAVDGTASGIDLDGALLVRTDTGLERHLSGEVERVL
jgi:BirA family biotin operon repressor/biotin-[acetyl-CoA-carboxylase] ligase